MSVKFRTNPNVGKIHFAFRIEFWFYGCGVTSKKTWENDSWTCFAQFTSSLYAQQPSRKAAVFSAGRSGFWRQRIPNAGRIRGREECRHQAKRAFGTLTCSSWNIEPTIKVSWFRRRYSFVTPLEVHRKYYNCRVATFFCLSRSYSHLAHTFFACGVARLWYAHNLMLFRNFSEKKTKANIFTIMSSDLKCSVALGVRTNEVVG